MPKNLFRSKHSIEDRQKESDRIRIKYPDKVPIIVTKSSSAVKSLVNIDRNKFLAPEDLTIGQFLTVIRKRIKVNDSESIFLFIDDNTMPPTSVSLNQIYHDYKDDDGFLYITYCSENVFG
jgi:GABA(A) receptor-associated protein